MGFDGNTVSGSDAYASYAEICLLAMVGFFVLAGFFFDARRKATGNDRQGYTLLVGASVTAAVLAFLSAKTGLSAFLAASFLITSGISPMRLTLKRTTHLQSGRLPMARSWAGALALSLAFAGGACFLLIHT